MGLKSESPIFVMLRLLKCISSFSTSHDYRPLGPIDSVWAFFASHEEVCEIHPIVDFIAFPKYSRPTLLLLCFVQLEPFDNMS